MNIKNTGILINPKSVIGDSQKRRIKMLYESINNLNNTIKSIQFKPEYITIIQQNDELNKWMETIHNDLNNIVEQMKVINVNLKNIQTNTGLIGIIVRNGGEVDKFLDELSTSVDNLCQTITMILSELNEAKNENGGDSK